MPWEYRVVIAHRTERDRKGNRPDGLSSDEGYCRDISAMLNRRGQEGWEVVGVHIDSFFTIKTPVYTLKRFVEQAPPSTAHLPAPPTQLPAPPPPPPPPGSYPPPVS